MKRALSRERKSFIFLMRMSLMMLDINEFIAFTFEDDEDLTN